MTTPLAIFLELWTERIPASVLPYIEAVNSPVDTSQAPDHGARPCCSSTARRRDAGLDAVGRGERQFLIGLFTRSGSARLRSTRRSTTSGRPSTARIATGS